MPRALSAAIPAIHTYPLCRSLLKLLALVIVLFLALFVSPTSVAQSISVQIESKRGYVDEPIRLTVTIENAGTFEGPFVESADGLAIERLPGEQSFKQRSSINGRVTEKNFVGISYEITPLRAGELQIPAFTMRADGQTYASQPLRIQASISEAGDLLLAEVRSEPATMYVGQEGRLELRVAVRRFTDPQLAITIDERSMWNMLARATKDWGSFLAPLQQMESEGKRPRGELEMIDGKEYIVFTVSKPFEPITTGAPSIGDAKLRINYPVRLSRGFDGFFGSSIEVAESRPVSVTPTTTTLDVRTPPEGGRPDIWNGAVGSFRLEAAAKPTEVAVGDPITVTLRITDTSGTAGLDGLQAPDLRAQPAFATGFRLPTDAAAGVIDGRSKVFTLSLRATSDAVLELPPIAFASFDPVKGAYETVQSAAIPLVVRPSTVARPALDPITTQSQAPGDIASQSTSASTQLTRIDGGMLANASTPTTVSTPISALLFVLAFLIAPIAFGIAWLVARSTIRDANNPLRMRLRTAHVRARERLAIASDPDQLASALLGYVADRTGSADGTCTRRDACEQLARDGVSDDLVQRVDAVLRSCERARYGGERVADSEIRTILDQLESTWQSSPRSAR